MQRAGVLLPAVTEHALRSPIRQRLLSPFGDEGSILFQHSVMCQTSMPYRDPGNGVLAWERSNGRVGVLITAGSAYSPRGEWVQLGLPFGPKPRLVLYHLNAEALRRQSPVIELEDSLTAFVGRTLGLDPMGRNIRIVKDQLSRLAAADFRYGMGQGGLSVTIKGSVIDGFELWTPKDEKQRVLWPTTIRFSRRYFDSLMRHAVPLEEGAVTRLSHSGMGLDVYTRLAQRLHRVDPAKPALVPWVALKKQFGSGYGRMDNFKRVFRTTLHQVLVVYPAAKFSLDSRGMLLFNSAPPVQKKLFPVRGC